MDVGRRNLSPITGWAVVVEDDLTLRMLTVEILAEIGLQSLDFRTADAAFIFLLQTHGGCPLVIVDQGLPGRLQGGEFIEMVKSRWPTTSAILTSGLELDPAMVPASTIYLQKPWSMDAFVHAVENCLQPDYSAGKI
ncbi:response regulator [Pseudomonas sp. 10S4]|uniref:response regulator n=1 Tax=Pseudomonas sp. 10S4 TaxID=3048583 RepID=UPI002AC944EA|nr:MULTISPECIES: response regulator [unclassified Pseudomonas]MEB0223606.1 response regulator [Pseudomonas sp. 5S1]MEB0297754.1 response regulator [Pseudomonas sp. 10S4]WPX21046.1 response regulator [Pseudomonas sp. 10S4]